MPENVDTVSKGFNVLLKALAPYVATELRGHYDEQWWQQGVLGALHDKEARNLPKSGKDHQLILKLDVARCLKVMDNQWHIVFRTKLSSDHRNWLKELQGTRNKVAHRGLVDFDSDEAWRALDTMARLSEQIDAVATEDLRAMARKMRYGTDGGSRTNGTAVVEVNGAKPKKGKSATGAIVKAVPVEGLKSWRDVAVPHPDVAQGRYRQAEFAADLSQVVRGKAQAEYQDPVEFFDRTFITTGMEAFLQAVLERLTGKGGEPVIQLKTSFGGGKTHTLLALYHLLRATKSPKKLRGVSELLQGVGLDKAPKAKVVVLACTALNPTKSRRPTTFPGITIKTLWGELTAQIAEQAGDQSVYDVIKTADAKGVPPGSDTLRDLFDANGPVVILIDELVAYARKIHGVSGLPAGTFGAVLTFVQELTEAVRQSEGSVVVATIPESDIEIGGEAGKDALDKLQHTFGRMEAIWKPVAAEEGFEVVRRRLFLPIKDEDARDDTCRAFRQMYTEAAGGDFPIDTKEGSYFDSLCACYPIHPEVFDRLYDDWSTLERFQRTRGVLRLMAAAIHELWMQEDRSLLIMPGSIPLSAPQVKNEFTRYLSENWNAIVDRDVDGPGSEPAKIDGSNPRYGRYGAARRVARTIFLGSAPTVSAQHARGLEQSQILLGTTQPGEEGSVFVDARNKLEDRLSHLYESSGRYWYDERPNLRRTAMDRAEGLKQRPEEIQHEIEERIRAVGGRGLFVRVHRCVPSGDIADDPTARLVVLGPEYPHTKGGDEETSVALVEAREIVERRGDSPRNHKNMLIFIAPDDDGVEQLRGQVRQYLAWKSIADDTETLNLDARQQKQAVDSRKACDLAVKRALNEVYSWLIVPTQEGTGAIQLEVEGAAGADSFVNKATDRVKRSEHLIAKWSPALLKMELDKWLWKDVPHVRMRDLWGFFTKYCYLPRLQGGDVLTQAIQDGLLTKDFFGYASAVDEGGRYVGLSFGGPPVPTVTIDEEAVLVKADVAEKQIAEDTDKGKPGEAKPVGGEKKPVGGEEPGKGTEDKKPMPPKRFHGTVALSPERLGRDAGKIAEEVVQHLAGLVGADLTVSLEISATVPDGVPENVQRIVEENCRTLKFDSHGFEEE